MARPSSSTAGYLVHHGVGLELAACDELPAIDNLLDRLVAENTRPQPAMAPIMNGIRDIIKNGSPVGERSRDFNRVVWSLAGMGRSVDDIEQRLEQYPKGIAAKYAGRLRTEIERCYQKWGAINDATNANAATWEDPDWSLLDDSARHPARIPCRGAVRKVGGVAGACCAWCRRHPWSCRGAAAGDRRQSDRDRAPGPSITILVGTLHAVDCGRRLLRHRQDTRHRRNQACLVPDREHPQDPDCEAPAPARHQGATAKAEARLEGRGEEAVKADQPPPQMPVAAMDPGLFVTPRSMSKQSQSNGMSGAAAGPAARHADQSDELASLFLNMGRYSNGSDKEFWLESGTANTTSSSAWAGLRS